MISVDKRKCKLNSMNFKYTEKGEKEENKLMFENFMVYNVY